MDVKVLFTASRPIHPKHGSLTIGKYSVEPLPTPPAPLYAHRSLYLLCFPDDIRPDELSSHPQAEAKLFLAYLSLLLGTKLEIESAMINAVPMPLSGQDRAYAEYDAVLEELPDLGGLVQKLQSKEREIARQCLRAAEVYRAGVNLIGQDNTLSFFLLTIAVECLSNKVSAGAGSCEKFVAFVQKYLPDKSSLESDDDWREVLKEIYYRHRSGFTHGGKEIPEASALADRLNRVYVRNEVDGKSVRTPGLKWYEKVVRTSILAFIESADGRQEEGADHLKDISMEYGSVKVKATKPIVRGRVVTLADVDLD